MFRSSWMLSTRKAVPRIYIKVSVEELLRRERWVLSEMLLTIGFWLSISFSTVFMATDCSMWWLRLLTVVTVAGNKELGIVGCGGTLLVGLLKDTLRNMGLFCIQGSVSPVSINNEVVLCFCLCPRVQRKWLAVTEYLSFLHFCTTFFVCLDSVLYIPGWPWASYFAEDDLKLVILLPGILSDKYYARYM